MWFDSDEEYEQYQWKKTKKVLLVIGAFIVFYGVAYLFSPKDKEHNSQEEMANTTIECQEDNEKILKPNTKTDEGQLTEFNVYDNTMEKLVPEIDPMPQLEVTTVENTETYAHDQGIEIENEEAQKESNDFSRQKVYDIVEVMPAFPGGDYELIRYMEDNLDYPQEAKESGIQGRVFVKFVVEPNGNISNVEVLRGIGYGCDEEAMRVVQSMPKWIPGKRKGKPVRVSVTIPVKFMFQ